MTRTFLIALPLFAFACSESGLHSLEDKGDGEGPAIEVTPDLLDFGTLSQADEPVVRTFTIMSVGATDLEVDAVTIDGAAAGSFTVLTSPTSFVLPPGTEQTVDVIFEPVGAYDQLAQALVSSNDEDHPSLPVELVGNGAVAELAISPDPLDFGGSYVGCEKDNQVTLSNVGTDRLVISDIAWAGDAQMGLTADYGELPMYLDPGQEAMLTFWFNPEADIAYTGQLSVTSNEPLGVRYADQTGTGRYAGDYADAWEIPSDPPSDILFAVDQSCSMDDDQVTLANNFSSFITQLSGYSNDWQIIVANADTGCNNSGLLRPSMSASTYQSAFASAVQDDNGADWYTESLLTVAANAVEQTGTSACNSGFIRPDAMLHVILVSDEPEQSSYTSGQGWADLVTRIQDAKGSAGMTRISAVAGPVPGGCGSADPGTGYSEAVNATSGVFLSICSNWASPSNLALLAEASINQANFELSRTPVPETIEVFHNGNQRSDATWTYSATDNIVTFTEAVPTEGDEVEVTYSGAASCD